MDSKSNRNKCVLLAVKDLIFSSKIRQAFDSKPLELIAVRDQEALDRALQRDLDDPLLIADLEIGSFDIFEALRDFKQRFPSGTAVGFYSHVNAEIGTKALQAGADEAFVRSKFVQTLQSLVP